MYHVLILGLLSILTFVAMPILTIFVIDLLIGLFIADFDLFVTCFLLVSLFFVRASFVSLRFSFVITSDVFS